MMRFFLVLLTCFSFIPSQQATAAVVATDATVVDKDPVATDSASIQAVLEHGISKRRFRALNYYNGGNDDGGKGT